MPGTVDDPVRLWPWSRITEVHWPANYYSDHGINYSHIGLGEMCSLAVGTAAPEEPGAYIDSCTFTPIGPNGGGVIHREGGASLTGTCFGFPTAPQTFAIAKWKALDGGHVLTGHVNGGSFTVRASARSVLNVLCKFFPSGPGPEMANYATPGGMQEFRAFTADFGGVSFIETETGNEYLFHHGEVGPSEPTGVSFRVFWRKALSSG